MLEDVHVIHNMHWRSRSPDLRRNGTRSALDLTFHRVLTVLYVILYLIAFFVMFCCAFCCHSVRYIRELVPRNIDSSFDDSYEASPPPPSEPLPGPQPNETWLLTVINGCHAACPSYFFTIFLYYSFYRQESRSRSPAHFVFRSFPREQSFGTVW